jgi:hypothetical protein
MYHTTPNKASKIEPTTQKRRPKNAAAADLRSAPYHPRTPPLSSCSPSSGCRISLFFLPSGVSELRRNLHFSISVFQSFSVLRGGLLYGRVWHGIQSEHPKVCRDPPALLELRHPCHPARPRAGSPPPCAAYIVCRAEFLNSAEITGHRRAGLSPRNPAEIPLFDFQFSFFNFPPPRPPRESLFPNS